MTKVDYDKREGFCAEETPNLPKPRKRDWKFKEESLDNYIIETNDRTNYAMATFKDGTKLMGRTYDILVSKLKARDVG